MEQQIRFCTSADGTRIAHATYSDRTDRPLLISRGYGFAQELCWREPVNRDFLERLGDRRMVVTYDRRGVGGSQRDVADLSNAAETADFEAVVEAAGLEQFDILSFHMVGVTFAARHPERVARLVLSGPYARPADTGFLRTVTRTTDVIRTDWAIARRALASYLFPDGPAEVQRWYSNMLRDCMSPEVAAALLETEAEQDVDYTEELSSIQAPTLVLHREDRMVPLSAAQQAAASIPNCRFVALEPGRDVVSLDAADMIIDFLDEERGGTREVRPRGTQPNVVAILFTDIADSTALTQRLGDAKAQELVRSHNTIVREALRQHGGSEIKHTGDGIMASFQSASGALDCAVNIQLAVALRANDALQVHIGLNAGEPVVEENDLFGTAVQLARRICDHAGSGKILASDVVRQLAAGKGFVFAARDVTKLKGFDEPVQFYDVRWKEDT